VHVFLRIALSYFPLWLQWLAFLRKNYALGMGFLACLQEHIDGCKVRVFPNKPGGYNTIAVFGILLSPVSRKE
jgi:hypothetical protein